MLKQPESMEECVYFTRRTMGDKGNIVAWTFREKCPKCKKELMGKPVEKGKVKIRAKEYKCPGCGYTVSAEEYEPTLTVNVKYTCPECGNEGETTTQYKRKSWQGTKAYVFTCQKCKATIGITKKMKEPKKGKEEVDEEE